MYSTQQQQADQMFWLVFLGAWFLGAVFFAIIGSIIGDSKNRRSEGAILGLLFGVIGIIAIAVMKDPTIRPLASAGWLVDPYGEHQYRWWDGTGWSQQVSDNGVQSVAYPAAPRPQTVQPVQPNPPPPVQPH